MGMPDGFEAPHRPFSLARGLMRVFGSVIQSLVLPVFDTRKDLAPGRAVAGQFIRDDHARDVLAAFQQLAEKFLRRVLVPPALHENIEDTAVLVNRPPQRGGLPIDRQEHLVQVPLVSRSETPTAEFIRILLTKLQRPPPDGFVAQHNTACGHEFFNITKAH